LVLAARSSNVPRCERSFDIGSMDYASQVVLSSAMWMAALRLPVAAHRKADALAFL
jgi:hypothetical protein